MGAATTEVPTNHVAMVSHVASHVGAYGTGASVTPVGADARRAGGAPAGSLAETGAPVVSAEVAAENDAWVRGLLSAGAAGNEAHRALFNHLLRAAIAEAHWRSSGRGFSGPELDDLAHQAAADALISVVAKLDTFRGDCRLTTWAYRFAALNVRSKINRHPWQRPDVPLRLEASFDAPAGIGGEPGMDFEARELATAVRRVMERDLTARQRQVLIATMVEGVPPDELAERLGSNRNAIYKVLFDARKKLRLALIAEGYTGSPSASTRLD